MTFAQLDKIADAVNPALAVLLMFAPLKANWRRAGIFLVRSWLAVGAVYLLAHLPRWLHWFGGHPFPSGHLAFALSVVASLVVLNRWWWFLAPLVAAYAALIVALGFHNWLDIAGALPAFPLTFWFHRFSFANLPNSFRKTPLT